MSRLIVLLFSALVMTTDFFIPQASIAAVTPDKKACDEPHIYIDPQGLMQFGSYDVFVEGKGGKWALAGNITEGKNYVSKQLDLSAFLKPGEAAKIRIVNTDGNAAHIDSVTLGGLAPSSVMLNGISDDDAARKLAKSDMDVMPAHEKVIDLAFPANRKDAKLTLLARIEALHITLDDFKFPTENTYKDIGTESKFFTYELGANVGKLSLKGKPGETGAMTPFFKEFSPAGTGHPSAFTYGWVMNDDKYLYVAIDFTGDNTEDGNKDYTKVFAKINGKVREFKISEDQAKWGKPSFTYTDKVAYQHKYYEFRIPLEEVGAKESKSLELAFAAYGTCASTLNPASPYSFGNVTVGSSSAPVSVTVTPICGGISFTSTVLATGVNFSRNNNTCTPGGALPCTFTMTFSPTTTGLLSDSITVNTNGTAFPPLNISGTGVRATVGGCTNPNATNYNPSATVDDGSCQIPQPRITTPDGSAPHSVGGGTGGSPSTTGQPYTDTLTFTNNGNGSGYIYSVERTSSATDSNASTQGGGISPPFYIAADHCTETILRPHDSCAIDIVFFPIEDGTYTQTLNLWMGHSVPVTYTITGASTSVTGNNKPAAFTTVGSVVNGTGVTLSWNTTTDPDKDAISYSVQYCENSGFINCAPQSAAGAVSASASNVKYGLSMAGAIMMFGFMAFGGIQSRRFKLLLTAFALSLGALAQSCGGSASTPAVDSKPAVMSKSFTGLKADTTYYWKMVASDGRGGAVESDTKTFLTGH